MLKRKYEYWVQSHHHSSLGLYFKIYWNLGEEIKTWNEGQDQKEKRESTRFDFSHNACYSCHCWRAVMIRKENDDDERVSDGFIWVKRNRVVT